jgi:hypothetical protein
MPATPKPSPLPPVTVGSSGEKSSSASTARRRSSNTVSPLQVRRFRAPRRCGSSAARAARATDASRRWRGRPSGAARCRDGRSARRARRRGDADRYRSASSLVTSGRAGLEPVSGASPRASALRFLAGHIAFVEGHFAALADIDIDAPALALGRLLNSQVGNARTAARSPHRSSPRPDRRRGAPRSRHSARPERVGVGEIAVLAEQVGDGRKPARLDVEQGMFDRDRLPAEQPCLQLVAGRAIGLSGRRPAPATPSAGSCWQASGGGRSRGRSSRRRVDRADARQQIAEREDARTVRSGRPKVAAISAACGLRAPAG